MSSRIADRFCTLKCVWPQHKSTSNLTPDICSQTVLKRCHQSNWCWQIRASHIFLFFLMQFFKMLKVAAATGTKIPPSLWVSRFLSRYGWQVPQASQSWLWRNEVAQQVSVSIRTFLPDAKLPCPSWKQWGFGSNNRHFHSCSIKLCKWRSFKFYPGEWLRYMNLN